MEDLNDVKKINKLIITCVTLCITIASMNNVFALSKNSDNQTCIIDGVTYYISIDENELIRNVIVTDENNVSYESSFNKETNTLYVNGEYISAENNNDNSTTYFNYVLERNTYTFGSAVTSSVATLLSALTAISTLNPFAITIVQAVINGALFGKTLTVTITEYRSGLKITSGTYAGKYKYWTNVLVKVGSTTILDQDHSIYYK